MKILTVELELLRTGAPHNRLLSPETRYLALCGDHDPEEVRVPYEHYQFLRRLAVLRYEGGETRERSVLDVEVAEIREALTVMLGEIRSLSAELTAASAEADLIELRLVLSPAELSLLPFELIAEPGVAPRRLTSKPIVMIRRSRRVPRAKLTWPDRPRILFAFAGSEREVPVERHLLALRQALAPWLLHVELLPDEEAIKEVAKYLDVLPRASAAKIQQCCTNRRYSHIHILAHGKLMESAVSGDIRYGLVLHDDRDDSRAEVVDGRQLASALVAGGRLPSAVTLASCDSANSGSVLLPSGSVAYELHDAGVPLVIASQFPLTFLGSAHLTACIYQRLLWSSDPRDAVNEARSTLYAQSNRGVGRLDWASVIAYGAFPENLEEALSHASFRQVRRALDANLACIDPDVHPSSAHIAATRSRDERNTMVAKVARTLDGLLQRPGMQNARKDWYVASVWKRWAEASERLRRRSGEMAPQPADHEEAEALIKAERAYERLFRREKSPSALVQSLAVRAYLGRGIDAGQLALATRLLHYELESPRRIVELGGDMYLEYLRASVEAGLLSLLVPALHTDVPGGEPFDCNLQLLSLCEGGEPNLFEYYSLRRQLRRYVLWSPELAETAAKLDSELERREFSRYGTAVIDWSETDEGYERPEPDRLSTSSPL